jgi:DNA invertase Pin-like site-specific DNA recombinase
MQTDIKKICCYIRTSSQDPSLSERIEFLKSVVALHEDWECVGFVIDKSKRAGIDRPDLSEIVEKMEKGEIKYIVVTHFSVIHPNLGILQKLADKLKGMGCGIVSLHERVNTLYLNDTIRNTILPKSQNT